MVALAYLLALPGHDLVEGASSTPIRWENRAWHLYAVIQGCLHRSLWFSTRCVPVSVTADVKMTH